MSDCNISRSQLFNITSTTLNKAQKRWRLAYWTVYCAQAMLSLKSKTQNLSQQKYPAETSCSHNPIVERTELTEMVKNKDLQSLRLHGGVEGVATALGTSPHKGISCNNQDIRTRSELFGTNTFPKPPTRWYLHYAIGCFKETNILILLACAALFFGISIKEHRVEEGLHDGAGILLAVFLLVAVTALSDFQQETQFRKLSELRYNFNVEVVRDGRIQQIPRFDLVVGDVVLLKIGDEIPADGLFLDGCSLKVDESSMTGKPEHVEIVSRKKPFLISGSKVVDGYAQMILVSVGMNTAWGEMISSMTSDSHEKTRLQGRVENLASSIRNLGFAAALVFLLIVLEHYFKGKTKDESGNKEYNGSKTDINDVFNSVGSYVLAAVTIVVAAVLVGLPLVVKLTFSYAMKRMRADQAIVSKLLACETMGSATVICTNKTGTLTLNQMEVTKFWIGQESIDEESHMEVASNVRELFDQAVGLNTTGSVFKPDSGSMPEFSGSPTEKAILSWAVQELGMDMETVKRRYSVLQFETFNSEKKRSGVSIRKKADKTIHVHWKGDAELILSKCSHFYERNGVIKTLDEAERSKMENIIYGMAASGLRCIAFAYRQIPDEEMECNEDGNTHQRLKEDGLTFLGIVGFKDPCRPEVRNAVQICNSAGVEIKMITGDNVFTAKAIATECGILRLDHQAEGGEVVQGKEFRDYTEEERMQKVDKIRVMARASPLDKHLMVECLKKKGHVVAVTADGKNDTSALKEADIGLCMGIQGSGVAQENFDVIVDDGFTSVATAIRWGRYAYNNIQKFIQFQLTVNVTALVINVLVAAVSRAVAITAFQLLWVNLIISTLGALALATTSSTDFELINRGPNRPIEPLITNIMWRNLLCQSLYQIVVSLFLKFLGGSIFEVSPEVIDSMIFNTFVLCQVFNVFNARKSESKNIFEGIHKNGLFLGIVVISIALQFLMVEFGNKFDSIERLNWEQWGECFSMAAVSWPVGWIVNFIPVPERPLFTNSDGDLDFGFGKIIKYLCCCLLNSLVPTEDII